jgi:hypothetical protein
MTLRFRNIAFSFLKIFIHLEQTFKEINPNFPASMSIFSVALSEHSNALQISLSNGIVFSFVDGDVMVLISIFLPMVCQICA